MEACIIRRSLPDPIQSGRPSKEVRGRLHTSRGQPGEVPLGMQYWEDEADAMRPTEGTLLPLWRYGHPGGKRKVRSAARPPASVCSDLEQLEIMLHNQTC